MTKKKPEQLSIRLVTEPEKALLNKIRHLCIDKKESLQAFVLRAIEKEYQKSK